LSWSLSCALWSSCTWLSPASPLIYAQVSCTPR
jgi:hypothetical protein